MVAKVVYASGGFDAMAEENPYDTPYDALDEGNVYDDIIGIGGIALENVAEENLYDTPYDALDEGNIYDDIIGVRRNVRDAVVKENLYDNFYDAVAEENPNNNRDVDAVYATVSKSSSTKNSQSVLNSENSILNSASVSKKAEVRLAELQAVEPLNGEDHVYDTFDNVDAVVSESSPTESSRSTWSGGSSISNSLAVSNELKLAESQTVKLLFDGLIDGKAEYFNKEQDKPEVYSDEIIAFWVDNCDLIFKSLVDEILNIKRENDCNSKLIVEFNIKEKELRLQKIALSRPLPMLPERLSADFLGFCKKVKDEHSKTCSNLLSHALNSSSDKQLKSKSTNVKKLFTKKLPSAQPPSRKEMDFLKKVFSGKIFINMMENILNLGRSEFKKLPKSSQRGQRFFGKFRMRSKSDSGASVSPTKSLSQRPLSVSAGFFADKDKSSTWPTVSDSQQNRRQSSIQSQPLPPIPVVTL